MTGAKAKRELVVSDLTLRAATIEDAAFAADVATAAHPDDPEDPTLWRNGWQNEARILLSERFVASRGGRPVGYAARRRAREEAQRFDRIHAELLPDVRTPVRLEALFALLEDRAYEEGGRRFVASAWDSDTVLGEALGRRGFREERRQRFWQLDLRANRANLERMARESRERMRAQGVAILTLAADDDPEKYRKLWRMSEEAGRDVPRSTALIETPFDVFMEWMRSPDLHEDRIWIARAGDDIVGVSQLSFPPVRGVVSTDWTATARSVRGQGVARALKCETLLQAVALGVPLVRTDNDWRNAPILHLNESMGYELRGEKLMFLKAP
jgi:GNAT superfamily N-acetyltransferase